MTSSGRWTAQHWCRRRDLPRRSSITYSVRMAELRCSVATGVVADYRTPLLVVQQFEHDDHPGGVLLELDQRMGGALASVLNRGDFRARKDETLVLYPRDGEL